MKFLLKSLFLAFGALAAVSAYAMDDNNQPQTFAPKRVDKDGDVKMTTQTQGILAALDQCGGYFQDPNFHPYVPRNERSLYACMALTLNDKPITGIFGYTMEVARLSGKYDRMDGTHKYKNRDTFLLTTQELHKSATQCAHQNTQQCEKQLETARYFFKLLKEAHDADTIKK